MSTPDEATKSAIDQPPSFVRVYGVVLTVGMACGLAISSVDHWTRPIIQANRLKASRDAVLNVLPESVYGIAFVTTEDGHFEKSEGPMSADVVVGYDSRDTIVGVAMETHGMGYQDTIRLIYGYSIEQESIIGVQVLESRETPGLGDRIETDDDFVENFRQLDVRLDEDGQPINRIEFVARGKKSAPWQVDGITGATISSRAVTEMISEHAQQWLPIIQRHHDDFLPTTEDSAHE